MIEYPCDIMRLKILGQDESYCCFTAIPNKFKNNIDWLDEFVSYMKTDCQYCKKTRGDHTHMMQCKDHQEQ